jgi:signal transduction histidine kinase
MALALFHRGRWRSWWWSFGALIALPALVLALLGASAIRADEVERRRQLADERQKLVLLADTTLARTLDAAVARARTVVTAQSTTNAAGDDATFFVMDDRGVLTFPAERVFIGPAGSEPPLQAMMTLSPETRALVAQAQAAEAQGRPQDARDAYERLRPTTELGRWAEWRLSVLRSTATESPAPHQSPTVADSAALSPSGIPVAVLASATAEHLDPSSRRRMVPLMEATLRGLRAGRWWLALEQRRFYDGELRRWLALAWREGTAVQPDARLDVLATLASRINESFAAGEHVRSGARMISDGHARMLLRWIAPQQRGDSWTGVAIGGEMLNALLSQALQPVALDHSLELSQVAGGTRVWASDTAASRPSGAGAAADVPDVRVPLPSFPGWTLTFAAQDDAQSKNGAQLRRALDYARVVVPLVVLACGLVMATAIMRRELALAKLQSTFVSAVTHEFKSPLTAIRLLMERLASGHLSAADTPGRYHQAISGEVERLESLVNRLLEAQRLQSGRKHYAPAPVSLPSLVDEAVSGMQAQAHVKGITLSTRTTTEIPAIEVDVESVRDALRNLVDNAIKYSPAGTTVDVDVRMDGDQVAVCVADEGVGVDAEETSRLFEPFYRGRRGDRANVRGTGLGLALVKATVEAHGGSVTVTPRTPRGSCFTMRLPGSASRSMETV